MAGALAEAGLITLLTFSFVAGLALAGKGGNGNGHGSGSAAPTASCSVDGTTVSAAGLPPGEVINFMIADASGSRGWVLGFSGDGTWLELVPLRTGPTTYEFVSRTWGPNGSHYNVFASCSAT